MTETTADHSHGHPHHPNPHPHPKPHPEVAVIYNGVPKDIKFDPQETVKALLDRSIQAFGNLPQPHMLSLFNMEGRELQDANRLKDEGVKDGDKLLLRPSAVKGG
jgi:hypothetical protein